MPESGSCAAVSGGPSSAAASPLLLASKPAAPAATCNTHDNALELHTKSSAASELADVEAVSYKDRVAEMLKM